MADGDGARTDPPGASTDAAPPRADDRDAASARDVEALRWSDERYRLAVLATNHAIWDWDLIAGTLAWSDTVEGLFGHSRAALGSSLAGWSDQLHPDDRERVVESLHAAVRSGARRWQEEYRFRRRSGDWAVVVDRGFIVHAADGTAVRMVGSIQDVTEARRAEEARDRFFALAHDMLCVAGMDGRFRRVNPAFTRTLGYSPGELLATPFLDLIHPDDVAATRAEIDKLARGQLTISFENRYRHRDGSYRWLEWTSVPVEAERLLFATARDVTEQKRLAREARQRAEFEQQLIGIVSHDLRSPIGAILLGVSALARRESLDDRTARALLTVQSAAERANRMIRDLLDFTRARLGGGIAVHRSPADLHAVTDRVIEELQAAHPDRTFQVRHSGDGRGEWDADRLVQAIGNLASNAAQYGAADAPITVSTRGHTKSVVLEVHNSGEPIAPELLAQLFQPLRRGPQADRTGRSVGLGLYIVKAIVDAHRGRVSVRSRAEEGTCFTVVLPRAGPEPAGPG